MFVQIGIYCCENSMRFCLAAFIVLLRFTFEVNEAAAQDAFLRPIQNFIISEETDFEGGDILSAQGRLGLPARSLNDCANICLNTRGCIAFTYNETRGACLPKTTVSGQKEFRGATSAIHRNFDNQMPMQTPAATIDRSPYLDRASCDAVGQTLTDIAKSASVSWPVNNLEPSVPTKIAYSVQSSPKRMAAFLIVSFDQPVRFRGNGFYVLAPGGIGAFKSTFAKGKTRVVVPLFAAGRQRDGQFEVVPLTLSTVNMTADIIGPTACGERVSPVSKASIRIDKVPSPEFLIYDQFQLALPERRINSPSGDRFIDIFDAYFRIFGSKTRTLIAEITGTNPKFSPTGRFITAATSEGNYVFDALDGGHVGLTGKNIAWDVSDSFIIGDAAIWGAVSVSSPYVVAGGAAGDRSVGWGVGSSCHACSGIDDVALKLDLENNFLLASDKNSEGEYAVSLTTSVERPNWKSVPEFVSEQSGIVPATLPKRWETREPLRFTEVDSITRLTEAELTPDYQFIRKNLLIVQKEERLPASSDGSRRSPATGVLAPVRSGAEGLAARLFEQSGISFQTGKRFTRTEEKLEDVPGNRNVSFLPFAKTIYFGGMDCNLDPEIGPDRKPLITASSVDVWKLEGHLETLRLIANNCTEGNSATLGMLRMLHSSKVPNTFDEIPYGIQSLEAYYWGGGCNGDCGVEAELVNDRYIIIWAKGVASFLVYDRSTKQSQYFSAYRGKLLDRVTLSIDGRLLLQMNSDQTFAVFEMGDGPRSPEERPEGLDPRNDNAVPTGAILLGRYVDDELVVWTREGYFDASYEGSQQIYLKFKGAEQLFTFGQFTSAMRREDLFRRVLSKNFQPRPITYRVPPIVAGSAQQNKGQVSLTAEQLGGFPAKSLTIYQDGVATNQIDIADGKGRWSFVVDRHAASRWLSFTVADETGLTSVPQSYDLGEPAQKRKLRVLAIGIDEYDDPEIADLGFSKTDAFRFIDAISQYSNSENFDVQVDAMGDDQATKEMVLKSINDIVHGSGPETNIILYFSGHGLVERENFYLGLTATKVSALEDTALSWRDISSVISGAKSRVTVLLDNCHSGAAGQATFAINDGVSRTLVGKASAGLVVLSASKGRQLSIEDSGEGGGIFTTALVTVLSNAVMNFDRNSNRFLEISELYKGVKDYVGRATQGRQTPWLAMDRAVGEFSAF
jgi:Caspase domain/PAN domain